MIFRKAIARCSAVSLILALLSIGGITRVPASAQTKSAVNVGLIYSKTGLLATYGGQYAEGFAIGLDYATHGTGMVNGHKINVTERDDGGDPAKAVASAKEFIGQGYKIVGGSTSSGVALQMAPLAKENNVLFISGPAAADGITGNNRNTFRSGRQTYQDVLAAGTIAGTNLRGKRVLVMAQDSAFGQANVAAVRAVLGGAGASVDGLLVPLSANDFAPFAQKAKDAKPDLLFIAWAGATTNAFDKSLADQGVLTATKVVTAIAERSSYSASAPLAGHAQLFSYYFYQAPKNKVNDYLVAALRKQGKTADLFHPDGFVAAQMIVHAVEQADGDDVGKMISALEGWTFEAPKGRETVRAADHAMIQPMFVAKMTGSGPALEPQLLRTVPAQAVTPPIHPMK